MVEKGSIHSVTLSHQTVKGVVGARPPNKRWWGEAKDSYDIIEVLPTVGNNGGEKKWREDLAKR